MEKGGGGGCTAAACGVDGVGHEGRKGIGGFGFSTEELLAGSCYLSEVCRWGDSRLAGRGRGLG